MIEAPIWAILVLVFGLGALLGFLFGCWNVIKWLGDDSFVPPKT